MGFKNYTKNYTDPNSAHKPHKFCVHFIDKKHTAHKCTTGACVVYRPRQQRDRLITTHNRGISIEKY